MRRGEGRGDGCAERRRGDRGGIGGKRRRHHRLRSGAPPSLPAGRQQRDDDDLLGRHERRAHATRHDAHRARRALRHDGWKRCLRVRPRPWPHSRRPRFLSSSKTLRAKERSMRKALLIVSSVLLLVAATPKTSTTARSDWKEVEQAIGRAGYVQPGDVYKVSFPRSDLTVTADGVTIKPALALGSWAAFKDIGGGHVMTMGDLVVLESEVDAVIDALQKGGIDQSALHNHLIGESPHVMYIHFMGHGDPAKLARTLHDALALTKTPMEPPPAPPATPPAIDLLTADLDRIIGHRGKVAGGTYQFALARGEKIVEHGTEIPPAIMNIPLNFQPTGNGRAAITGDFVLIASEVNPVIRVLRSGGITITALHSHMLEETPRLFFIHFWANDDATKLATTLRSALDH